ncbi:MAG TPA: sulfatase-like hydrolase/transferase [Thermoanaerobaculia bacterium]
MRRSTGTLAAWVLISIVLAVFAAGCRRLEPWNVLLVTFDTTRADRIGCYGNRRIETPTLDRLAAEGVRFARAMSAAPITSPSHSSILTGRYPIAHGVRDNGLFVLGGDQLTLAEILRGEGYATAAAVGAYPLTARFGLDQGFTFFDDHLTGVFEDYLGHRVFPKQRLFFDERRAAQVNEAILPWLAEHAGGPFFVWVHYFDPHQPFEPAPPYDQLYADDLYDGEIAYADSRLGFLLDRLDELGVLERTLVVMTADHGEGLGDHNEVTHAVLAYNSTLHVPLIVRPPWGGSGGRARPPAGAAPAGTVVEERVGTVDVVPTVLDLLGVRPPEGLQGRSLVPLWQDDAPRTSTARYAENLSPRITHGWGELRVLFEGPLKYIHGPRPELYDLEADPGERHDLAAERPAEVRRLRDALRGFIKDNAVAGVSIPEELDDDVRRRLEALGYLHGSGGAREQISETLLDGGLAPQDRVGDVNDLSAAKHLLYKGRYAEALVYTEKLTRGAPRSPLYLELHATALSELLRLDEAWEVVGRLRAAAAVPVPLLLRLTARQFERGETRLALDFLRRHLATSPSAPGEWLLATFHQRLGEPEESLAALEKALETDPTFVPARIDLAVHFVESGEASAAEREFLRALEDAPYHFKACYNYGTFVLQDGRYAEAAGYFRRAIALAPSYWKAHLALVAAHLAADERQEAEAAYAALVRAAPQSQEAATAAGLLAAL